MDTPPRTTGASSEITLRVKVIIPSDKLSVLVKLAEPQAKDRELTVTDLETAIRDKRVTAELDREALEKLAGGEAYNEPVVVAKGSPPVPGEPARLSYKFNTNPIKAPKEGEDGRIDYKDIGFIQTAKTDQLLCEKTPPTEGMPGIDVFGNELSARSGTNVSLPAGRGTKASPDGLKLYAAEEGSIVFARGRININAVQVISGSICIETGNIRHLGTLIIHGGIESGFEVDAQGDIEIGKNVADAHIRSGGNVMTKGGFQGSGNGLIEADGDIHCKYVDSQKLDSGHGIYIGGELFNANVTAKKRVEVNGSNGRIVGGRIRAGEVIRASYLGSEAGVRTELQVASDVELVKRYYAIEMELKRLDDDDERVKDALYALHRAKLDGALPADKEKALAQLEQFHKQIPRKQQELADEKEGIEAKLRLNEKAHIIAERKVYPGTIIQFGIVYKEIIEEMGPSYFYISGSTIMRSEYRPKK